MIKLKLGHELRTHGWDAGRKIFDVGRHTFDSRQKLGHEPHFQAQASPLKTSVPMDVPMYVPIEVPIDVPIDVPIYETSSQLVSRPDSSSGVSTQDSRPD